MTFSETYENLFTSRAKRDEHSGRGVEGATFFRFDLEAVWNASQEQHIAALTNLVARWRNFIVAADDDTYLQIRNAFNEAADQLEALVSAMKASD